MDAVQDSLRGRDVPQARIQLEKFALA
jgi:hypothetical protein